MAEQQAQRRRQASTAGGTTRGSARDLSTRRFVIVATCIAPDVFVIANSVTAKVR